MFPDGSQNRYLIHNVLLEEAKKAYRAKKYAEIAAKIDAAEVALNLENTSQEKASEDTVVAKEEENITTKEDK